MFTCNICKKEYDNEHLHRYSFYISKWSGERVQSFCCNHCAADADNRAYELCEKTLPWKELSDKYPRIFNTPAGTDMFGKTYYVGAPVAGGVGMGWYPIIKDACEKIQIELDRIGPNSYCSFSQMKEKFGGLRWYTSTPVKNKLTHKIINFWNIKLLSTSYKHWNWFDKLLVKYKLWRFRLPYPKNIIQEIIDEAERKSYKICETCGEPGKLINSGWIKTSCKKHAKGYDPFTENEKDYLGL